jgi:hypothetical protein
MWASGPRARRRFTCGGVQPSSEAESHPRGVQPSSEAETRPRGRPAIERGGDFVARCLTLERGGDSPEGHRGWLLDGPLRFI